jgi:hypothetical protein
VNPLRDRCRGRKIGTFAFPVVSRFACDHRLPSVTPSGVEEATLLASCENQHSRMTTIENTATLTPCTNCGGASSDYCARCGERQPGHHDLSVAHFAHDVVHEFVHLDSKLFRTLRDIVTKPGFLTEEYFAGRKSRYIPPLRLFLTLFAL